MTFDPVIQAHQRQVEAQITTVRERQITRLEPFRIPAGMTVEHVHADGEVLVRFDPPVTVEHGGLYELAAGDDGVLMFMKTPDEWADFVDPGMLVGVGQAVEPEPEPVQAPLDLQSRVQAVKEGKES